MQDVDESKARVRAALNLRREWTAFLSARATWRFALDDARAVLGADDARWLLRSWQIRDTDGRLLERPDSVLTLRNPSLAGSLKEIG